MQKGKPASAACVFFLFLLLLLLLLLLTPVSPQCRTATPDECKLSGEFIPGHSLASRGFDITTLEHTQNNVLDLSEWEKSDGSCTLCENPLLHGKPLQRLPLAITDWKANYSCQQKVQHSGHPSTISVVKVMAELLVRNDWKKELDVEVNPIANTQCALVGSASKWVSFCHRLTAWDKFTFLLHHVSCSYYKFRIDKDKSVSAKFKDNLNLLPEKYNSQSKRNYYDLILNYGTHFITELDLGARVRYLSGVPVCLMEFKRITLSEISHCLEIELGVLIGFEEMTKHPDYRKCEEKRTNHGFMHSFIQYLMDREGGTETPESHFWHEAYQDPYYFIEWLESAKNVPALLSYSLEPLHTLVDKSDPRREGLRQAVSEYVKERAMWRNCTLSCPPGVPLSALDPCSCECPNDNFTTSTCCSREPGLANLTVTIQRAEGLWGDYITQSDGYVRVLSQTKEMCTSTVWNNNDPEWNTILEFGILHLIDDVYHMTSKIEIEVWDKDSGWNDDILGRCLLFLKAWESRDHICYLYHGALHFKTHLVCGPQLGGPFCRDYIRLWPKWKINFATVVN